MVWASKKSGADGYPMLSTFQSRTGGTLRTSLDIIQVKLTCLADAGLATKCAFFHLRMVKAIVRMVNLECEAEDRHSSA
jgi:hypothetical protein